MYPTAESESKVVYKEPLSVDKDYFLMAVFNRETLIEENT